MPDKIDLTGRWRFEEDFGFGKDSGYAEINQIGIQLSGILRFSEQIDGEETFIVKQEVTGKITGTKIDLKSHSCEILFSAEDIIYELDTWSGELLANGKIVGNSCDSEGTGGCFVMERSSYETSELKDDHQFGKN